MLPFVRFENCSYVEPDLKSLLYQRRGGGLILAFWQPVSGAEISDADWIYMGLKGITWIPDDAAFFSGTLVEEKSDRKIKFSDNNRYDGYCQKITMTCWISDTIQIGPKSIITESPQPYDVKTWNREEIIVDDGNDIPPEICYKTTIVIKRKSVDWFVIPVNQHLSKCRDLPLKEVTHSTLEESVAMKILFKK